MALSKSLQAVRLPIAAPRPLHSIPSSAVASSVATAAVSATSARPAGWGSAKPFREIPGLRPLPLLGNSWRFIPWIGRYGRLNRLERQLRLRDEFGPLVRLSSVGGEDALWVFDPSFMEMVYRLEGPWPLRGDFEPLTYYRKVLRKERFNSIEGTLSSQGHDWYSFRSKVNQPMMQPASAKQYLIAINEVADDFIERIRKLRDDHDELPSNFINELYKWSLESIAFITLNIRLGCLTPNLRHDSEQQRMIDAGLVALDEMFFMEAGYSLWKYMKTPALRRFVEAMDTFSDLAEKHIMASLRGGAPRDGRAPSIFQRLLERAPAEAKVMAIDMLLGGIDTTSHSTASLLFHLAKNPHVQRDLAEELRSVLPSPCSPVTAHALDDMPYLKACLRESLRLFPIISDNIRVMPKDVVIEGFQIPEGTLVQLCHGVAGRDEALFPEAARFVPGRWRKAHPLHGRSHAFAALPFGFGPRMCIGRRFAELEVLTLAAKICRQFSIEFHHGNELLYEEKAINFITTPLKFKLIGE